MTYTRKNLKLNFFNRNLDTDIYKYIHMMSFNENKKIKKFKYFLVPDSS